MALVPRIVRNVPIQTEWVDAGNVIISATTTAPTKGTPVVDKVWWRRNGPNMEVRIEYRQSTAGTVGSGDYLFKIPTSDIIDLTRVTSWGGIEGATNWNNNNCVGFGSFSSGSVTPNQCAISVYDNQYVRFLGINNASGVGAIGSGYAHLNFTDTGYQAFFSVPIVGWSAAS